MPSLDQNLGIGYHPSNSVHEIRTYQVERVCMLDVQKEKIDVKIVLENGETAPPRTGYFVTPLIDTPWSSTQGTCLAPMLKRFRRIPGFLSSRK
jgi:hypothetical protein